MFSLSLRIIISRSLSNHLSELHEAFSFVSVYLCSYVVVSGKLH